MDTPSISTWTPGQDPLAFGMKVHLCSPLSICDLPLSVPSRPLPPGFACRLCHCGDHAHAWLCPYPAALGPCDLHSLLSTTWRSHPPPATHLILLFVRTLLPREAGVPGVSPRYRLRPEGAVCVPRWRGSPPYDGDSASSWAGRVPRALQPCPPT